MAPMRSIQRMKERLQKYYIVAYRFAIGAMMMIKLSLVGWWPTLARMQEEADSYLFIRLGTSLLQGNWLGVYDYTTLMKGPMTPFWIAATNLMGWPTNFAREVLYLGACVLALKALSLICRSRWVLLLFFGLLVFFPASNSYAPLAALYRAAIHLPLVLGVESLLIIVFLKYVQFRRVNWHEVILLGLFLLAFFLNREETPWLYPQLAWLAVGILAIALWRFKQPGIRIQGLDVIKILLIPALIVTGGKEWVSNKNYIEYGIDATLEINRPEFKLAYTGLLRIKPEKAVKSAHFTPDVLEKLNTLPSGKALNWLPFSSRKIVPAMFVPWYFRGAIQNAGYYEKGGQAVLAYYQALGQELASACDNGLYECRPVLFGAIPLYDGIWLDILSAMGSNSNIIISLESMSPSPGRFNSFADYYYKRNMSLLTSAPMALTEGDIVSLPGYFVKWARAKTLLLQDIHKVYLQTFPLLIYLAFAIFVFAIIRCLRTRTIGSLEYLMLGLFGAYLTQLVVYSLLWVSGLSGAGRLYFNTYPLLLLFIGIAYIHFGTWLVDKFRPAPPESALPKDNMLE